MFSNRYIFIYSATLTIIVAIALSFAAQQLKPLQEKNIRIEKMQYILSAANINSEPKTAQQLYNKYIKETKVVNLLGEEITGNAFEIELEKEMKLPKDKMKMPIYICHFDNGEKGYIFQMRGKGLWGPIWGYICLKEDLNTVIGAVFDHKGETPGLGAEISTEHFSKQFKDKKIFSNDGTFKSIRVIKGGAQPNDQHGVDAITGGTITSNGVTEMIRHSLELYLPYIYKIRNNK